MQGKIKKIMPKGYGFITPEEGGKDVFFHRSKVSGGLNFEDMREGDPVQFEVEEGRQGPQAYDVVSA